MAPHSRQQIPLFTEGFQVFQMIHFLDSTLVSRLSQSRVTELTSVLYLYLLSMKRCLKWSLVKKRDLKNRSDRRY